VTRPSGGWLREFEHALWRLHLCGGASSRKLGTPHPLKEAIHLKSIHPELTPATVRCTTCGNTFIVRSTSGDLVVDVCSNCHQAYTGVVRSAPSGSRIERFERRRRLAGTR
jgi:large subunit ribosomal protein L31